MSATKTDPAVVRPLIPVVALGMSLGLFLAITFVLCVVWGLIVPGAAIDPSWQALLPGFTWISWQSFLLGLAESFAYGWYVALIFAPLFNFFSERQQR
jgi:hypothetical protein